MNEQSEQTVQTLGARSSWMVWLVTCFFALFMIGLGLLGYYNEKMAWLLVWAPLGPLCFLLIPEVHFLSRELILLQRRVKEWERKLERQ